MIAVKKLMYKKKINATQLIRFSLKIFWNRRHKNFVCLPEISFLLNVQFFFRIQAAISVKREEKFCYSFVFFTSKKIFQARWASC